MTEITGLQAPPSTRRAHWGEYAGLMVIRAYLRISVGKPIAMCLIPSSSPWHQSGQRRHGWYGSRSSSQGHGRKGNPWLWEDLQWEKATLYKDQAIACIDWQTHPLPMGFARVPSTEITSIIRQYGVYKYIWTVPTWMPSVALANPGPLGPMYATLALRKTFGPFLMEGRTRCGPICVAKQLVPFSTRAIPSVKTGGKQCAINQQFQQRLWGSALACLISCMDMFAVAFGERGLKDLLNVPFRKRKTGCH